MISGSSRNLPAGHLDVLASCYEYTICGHCIPFIQMVLRFLLSRPEQFVAGLLALQPDSPA